MRQPIVLVYRNQPLPISETFIYNQTMRLHRYRAYILGAKWPEGPSIELPEERVRVINEGSLDGWLQEFQWKVMGWVPKEILRWAKSLSPDLIHTHFGPDGVFVLPLARRLRLPLVVTFHGIDATLKPEFARSYRHKKYFRSRSRLAEFGTRFIAVSHFIRKKLLLQGFPSNKVIVHYIGVDVREIDTIGTTLANKQAKKNTKLILFVGRLVEKKGASYVIDAFRKASLHQKARLIIIGDGPLAGHLRLKAAKTLPGESYEFCGSIPHREVIQWMHRSDLLCVPSVTDETGDSEGLPTVVLEGMAAGLPIVGTYHAGIPEAVVHGETGLLCKERDTDALAKNMLMILENDEMAKKMGEAGRRRVEQEFNLEHQNAKLEALYDEVIEEHARRTHRK